jgi:hypothetical protein
MPDGDCANCAPRDDVQTIKDFAAGVARLRAEADALREQDGTVEKLKLLRWSLAEYKQWLRVRTDSKRIAEDEVERLRAEIKGIRAECDGVIDAILNRENTELVSWVRVVGEETVLAGYPGGDRVQTLKNIRAMRSENARLLEIINRMCRR